MGARSRILTELSDPTPFMALPRSTFPRGPKIMQIKIRGIVFSWSLRVCVTYSFNPSFRIAKNQENERPDRREKSSRKGVRNSKQRLHNPKSFARRAATACASIQHGKDPAAFGNFPDQDIIQERAARLPFSRVTELTSTGGTKIGNEVPCPQAS